MSNHRNVMRSWSDDYRTNIDAPHFAAGLSGQMAVYFDFILWASQIKGGPTYQAIMARYGMSRATAYRWNAAWRFVAHRHGLLETLLVATGKRT